MAGVVSDIPIKFVIAVVFNIILYFLAGLRAEPSQFFIYFLFVFVAILTMSSIFRSLAAMTKTLSQAMVCFQVLPNSIPHLSPKWFSCLGEPQIWEPRPSYPKEWDKQYFRITAPVIAVAWENGSPNRISAT